ncbi:MAG: PEP-CTERM sorting domain-containing protein [Cyanobacteria bacterium J06633_8]
MKLFNKLGIIAASSVLSLGFIQVNSAEAASIGRSDFNPDATEFNFDGTSGTDVTDGNLSVTNGVVSGYDRPTNMSGYTYFDGGDSSVIRFDFLEEVSALGMDFYANNADITFSVFDKSDNLIENLTLDWTTQDAPTGYPEGFIGLDVGSNLISYATIDTPRNGNELFVDNVVYQSAAQSVPEPASMLGLLAVTSLGAASLKGKFAKAKEAQNA